MPHEFSYVPRMPSGGIDVRRSEHGDWLEGYVYTRGGVVLVYSQGHGDDRRNAQHTSLRYWYQGRVYDRNWNVAYHSRHIVTLAERFVRDVLAGKCK